MRRSRIVVSLGGTFVKFGRWLEGDGGHDPASMTPAEWKALAHGEGEFWLAAVRLQRDRLRDTSHCDEYIVQADATFFALALRNLLRAAEMTLTWTQKAKGPIGRFLKVVPKAKATRDMLEHFDAYLLGEGDLQKSGRVDGYLVYFEETEESVKLHVGDWVLDVDVAATAAEDLGLGLLDVISGGDGRRRR